MSPHTMSIAPSSRASSMTLGTQRLTSVLKHSAADSQGRRVFKHRCQSRLRDRLWTTSSCWSGHKDLPDVRRSRDQTLRTVAVQVQRQDAQPRPASPGFIEVHGECRPPDLLGDRLAANELDPRRPPRANTLAGTLFERPFVAVQLGQLLHPRLLNDHDVVAHLLEHVDQRMAPSSRVPRHHQEAT